MSLWILQIYTVYTFECILMWYLHTFDLAHIKAIALKVFHAARGKALLSLG